MGYQVFAGAQKKNIVSGNRYLGLRSKMSLLSYLRLVPKLEIRFQGYVRTSQQSKTLKSSAKS